MIKALIFPISSLPTQHTTQVATCVTNSVNKFITVINVNLMIIIIILLTR